MLLEAGETPLLVAAASLGLTLTPSALALVALTALLGQAPALQEPVPLPRLVEWMAWRPHPGVQARPVSAVPSTEAAVSVAALPLGRR